MRALVAAATAVLAHVPGPSGPTPPAHYVQTTKCVTASNIPAGVKNGVSWAQPQLDYTSLWSMANRGTGQTVAVIDTGINPVSALGDRLHAGLDLVVSGGDGRSDCDGHGTVVAGIIAAAPDHTTGFAGVAPGAQLLSIRQSSLDYGIENAKQSASQNVAGTTGSLAAAIDYAVGTSAKIINISEDSCRPGNAGPDAGSRAVAAAVRRAVAADVVIVAAAGNVDSSSDCKTQNTPGLAPATIPVPAGLPGVLSVGAVDRAGRPAGFSLAGPWLDVAAPGTDIVSTNPLVGTSGQINRFLTSSGVSPIQGTSFAAPYVAGLVALVRARFPHLDARQVIARIERTAVHPAADGGHNDYVGHGVIDPRAALTDVLPGEAPGATSAPSQRSGPQTLPAAAPHHDPERSARSTALLGALGVLVAIVVGLIVTATRRRTGALSAAGTAGRGGRRRG
ncbi:MAG TPA: type VII secretion-associated serine protease mycosin [Jatrophihabitans sp.]|jgi:membrane-anchored mycosin MYCP